MTTPTLPTLAPARTREMLEPPQGRIHLIIDTDTHNEIDDQFALAWALLSQDVLDIEGILAAPHLARSRFDDLVLATHDVELGTAARAMGIEVYGDR